MDNFPRGHPGAMFFSGRGSLPGQFPEPGMFRGRPPMPVGNHFRGRPGNGNWARPPFLQNQPLPPGTNCGPPPFQDFGAPRGPPQRPFIPNNSSPQLPYQYKPRANFYHGNNNKNKKNRKQSTDKRDLAENCAFFCDICDRGFKTKECYDIHVNTHEKCKVEGCPYTAAPKLVQLHFNMQHKTGLAKKIWQFESKEDIVKWRAERKRNFPTASNVARKEADKADRVARGEVLETKFFGKFGNHPSERGRGRGRGRRRGQPGQKFTDNNNFSQNSLKRSQDLNAKTQSSSPKKQKSETSSLETTQSPVKAPAGDPLSFILPHGRDDSDDEPEALPTKPVTDHTGISTATNPLAAGGLGSLIASYGSESEGEGEETQEKPTTDTTETDRGDEAEVENIPDEKNHKGSRRQKRKRGRKGKQKQEVTSCTTKSSLLEKLLAPEIRHERNVILQCVRYIVRNNFFGLEKDNSVLESSNKGKPLSELANIDEEIWENGL